MITTPHRRRDDDGAVQAGAVPAGAQATCRHGCVAVRTVTAEQVDRAVAQLRERPGRSGAEQVQAVLRAFDLTVVPRIPGPR